MTLPDLQQSLPHLHFWSGGLKKWARPLPFSWWSLLLGLALVHSAPGQMVQAGWCNSPPSSLAKRLPLIQFQEIPEAERFICREGLHRIPQVPCDATWRRVEGNGVAGPPGAKDPAAPGDPQGLAGTGRGSWLCLGTWVLWGLHGCVLT